MIKWSHMNVYIFTWKHSQSNAFLFFILKIIFYFETYFLFCLIFPHFVCANAGFCEIRFNGGNKLPGDHCGDSGFDQRVLTAPIKSAVDKFQLLPEFLKVTNLLCSMNCNYVMVCEIII